MDHGLSGGTMRLRVVAGLLTVTALLAAPPAAAQGGTYCLPNQPPPRFYTAGFQADTMAFETRSVAGKQVLVATGGIGPDEARRFAAALAAAGHVDEVWLSSPGGVLREGIAMGRSIKKAGLATRIAAGSACMSACTFAFLGGPLRHIDADSWYGIHAFSVFFDLKNLGTYLGAIGQYVKNNDQQGLREFLMSMERSNAQLAADCAKFLLEVSASLEFLTGTFGQKQLGMCYLNRAGLDRYNVANAD